MNELEKLKAELEAADNERAEAGVRIWEKYDEMRDKEILPYWDKCNAIRDRIEKIEEEAREERIAARVLDGMRRLRDVA